MTAQSRLLLLIGVVAILVAACAGSASPSPAGSPIPSPIVVASPSATPTPASDPEVEPSVPVTPTDPSAKPEPTPTPAPLAWSKARTVKGLQSCSDVVATVDDAGTSHIAATCGNAGGQIKYAVSKDGLAWTVTSFKVPSGRFEQDPEIAFSGSTLYLAYTRVAPADGGCGDDGLDDVGVYVRSRSLPNGDWSAPSKIGATSDHLQAFRASGSVLHATVTNDKSHGTFYERVFGGAASRVRIGDGTGWTALRVGDDGDARLALDGAKGIRFGQIDGGKLAASTIPGTAGGSGSSMVLGPNNVAYVLWSRSAAMSGGCIDMDPGPTAGSYLSTNAGGSWQTTKLSKLVGAYSLTMDPTSGEIDALIGDFGTLRIYEKPAGAGWTHRTLSSDLASSAVVRRNPATGGLVVVYVHDTLDGDQPTTIQVMTKS